MQMERKKISTTKKLTFLATLPPFRTSGVGNNPATKTNLSWEDIEITGPPII